MLGPRSQSRCLRCVYHSPPAILGVLLVWSYWTALVEITINWHLLERERIIAAILLALLIHALWIPAVCSLVILKNRGPGYVEQGTATLQQDEREGENEPFLQHSPHNELRTRSPPKRHSPLPELDDEADGSEREDELAKVTEVVHSASKLIGFDDGQRHGDPNETVTAKANGQRRFCRKCMCYKPDRSHHCSTCGRCTLLLDHHCPMVAVDVGHRNRKAFILFLVYSCLYAAFCAIYAAYSTYEHITDPVHRDDFAPVTWLLLFVIGIVFALALVGFASYHVWLASVGRTTLEAMESTNRLRLSPVAAEDVLQNAPTPTSAAQSLMSYAEQRKLERQASKINIFDLGRRANLAQVFGPRGRSWLGPAAWILPFGPVRGDGLTWPTNPAAVAELEAIVRQLQRV